eukprot:TRINITY_DN4311_c0_g3_i4.p2 TRINITY_DN4311_c0_g3~~TRINITY_DN4311_c0_g3_i4.p2  ORF type:complete len:197 (-),score=58.71 TRINITY_DN4311_c0_g3_i4:769-1359(-)
MFPSFLEMLKPESHNYLEKVASVNLEIKRLEKSHREALKRNIIARHLLTEKETLKTKSIGGKQKAAGKLSKHLESAESFSVDRLESLTTATGLTRRLELRLERPSLQAEAMVQEQSHKDALMKSKKAELKALKLQELKRIQKVFAAVPPSSRKALLPKVVPALFGENLYEIEAGYGCRVQYSIINCMVYYFGYRFL